MTRNREERRRKTHKDCGGDRILREFEGAHLSLVGKKKDLFSVCSQQTIKKSHAKECGGRRRYKQKEEVSLLLITKLLREKK